MEGLCENALKFWGLNMQESERHARDRVNWSLMVYRGSRAISGLDQGVWSN